MQETLSKIENLYSGNLRQLGIKPASVGWKDETSQNLRFNKLAQVIAPRHANDGITVNDYGCGYGAMFNYLNSLPHIQIKRYTGYDISREMINAAKRYTDQKICEFKLAPSIDTQADYSFVSGTFNVKFENSDEKWLEYIKNCLVNINEFSKKGFSFNLLTEYVDYKEDHLYYGDPLLFFDYCKRSFSKRVNLIHDYNLFEWTLLVFKDEA